MQIKTSYHKCNNDHLVAELEKCGIFENKRFFFQDGGRSAEKGVSWPGATDADVDADVDAAVAAAVALVQGHFCWVYPTSGIDSSTEEDVACGCGNCQLATTT